LVFWEKLQVDYIFNITVIEHSQNEWEFTINRRHTYEETVTRKNDICEQCTLKRARQMLSDMVLALRPGGQLAGIGEAVLDLNSEPQASIFIDGIPSGTTPLTLTVKSNKNIELMLIKDGYATLTQTYRLKSGETKKENIILARKRGNLKLETVPTGARVSIDGKPWLSPSGEPLKTPLKLRPVFGEHQFTFKLLTYMDKSITMNINKKQMGEKTVTLDPKPGRIVVIVPPEYKNASIYLNGSLLGEMEGSIHQSFNVTANETFEIKAKDGEYESETLTFSVNPDSNEHVEFEDFKNSATPKKSVNKRRQKPYSTPSETYHILAFDLLPYSIRLGSNNSPTLNFYMLGLGYGFTKSDLYFNFGLLVATSPATTTFYFEDDSSAIYEVESVDANVFRAYMSPTRSGWTYGFGYEYWLLTLNSKSGTNFTVNAGGILVDGGYTFDFGGPDSLTFLSLKIIFRYFNEIGFSRF